jgi:glyoxylase-like metal-dependent hydrolase (beta-lactamase superfamily II)
MGTPPHDERAHGLGALRVDPVLDGYLALLPGVMYPDVDVGVWRDSGALDANGLLTMPHGGYLVRGHGSVVLVDAGCGPGFKVPAYAGQLYSSGELIGGLARLGVDPAAVTDVVVTHAHPDHVGWASQGGAAVFPNAAYWCHWADWQAFVRDRNYTEPAFEFVADQLAPLEPSVRTWSGSAAVTDWLRLHEAPGHTPGSAVAVAGSRGRRAAFIGDLAHHLLEVSNPGWAFAGDSDSHTAAAQRLHWFRDLADGETLVFASHFPEMSAVTLREGAWREA